MFSSLISAMEKLETTTGTLTPGSSRVDVETCDPTLTRSMKP